MKLKRIMAIAIVLTMLAAMTIPALGAVTSAPDVTGFYFQPTAGGKIYYFPISDVMDGLDQEKQFFFAQLQAQAKANPGTAKWYVETPVGKLQYDGAGGTTFAAQFATFAQAPNKGDLVTIVDLRDALTVTGVTIEEDGKITVHAENKDGVPGTIVVEVNDGKIEESTDGFKLGANSIGLKLESDGLTITATATVNELTDTSGKVTFSIAKGTTALDPQTAGIVEDKAVLVYDATTTGYGEYTFKASAGTASSSARTIVLEKPTTPVEPTVTQPTFGTPFYMNAETANAPVYDGFGNYWLVFPYTVGNTAITITEYSISFGEDTYTFEIADGLAKAAASTGFVYFDASDLGLDDDEATIVKGDYTAEITYTIGEEEDKTLSKVFSVDKDLAYEAQIDDDEWTIGRYKNDDYNTTFYILKNGELYESVGEAYVWSDGYWMPVGPFAADGSAFVSTPSTHMADDVCVLIISDDLNNDPVNTAFAATHYDKPEYKDTALESDNVFEAIVVTITSVPLAPAA